MLPDDAYYFMLGDREFYEPADRRRVNTSDYVDLATRRLPDGWSASRSGIWFHCKPPDAPARSHGWKIHVSTTVQSAPALLAAAAAILIRERVSFKFAADRFMLLCLNRKRWPRGSAGKFMTVYPRTDQQCGELLEFLREALVGFDGPYILSDRRYKDSRVLYYRYGGFARVRRAGVDGRLVAVMQLAGAIVDDQRRAAFHLPDGIVDPFEEPAPRNDDAAPPGTLAKGRYRIERVLAYSNAGGVYVARDSRSDRQVLVKEARPHTGQTDSGPDAVAHLRKEFRLLALLAATGIAPAPLDFFQDWEHYYLVEEFLEGETLRHYMATRHLPLRTRATSQDIATFITEYRSLFLRIVDIFAVLHAHHVVFGDVSHHNVMITSDGAGVRLIDFEGACEMGVDPSPRMTTPGFDSPQLAAGEAPRPEDDLFGLGGLMLSAILPIGDLSHLDRSSPGRFLRAWAGDFGLPHALENTILGLLAPARADRPSLADVRATLETLGDEPALRIGPAFTESSTDSGIGHFSEAVQRVVSHILSTMTPERTDRLFPGAPTLFEGHPASLAFGAAGVGYALRRITGHLDPVVIDWILARDFSRDTCAPGLYVGAAGVAWLLCDVGRLDEARLLIDRFNDHPLVSTDASLFYGRAGVGLANLKVFLATRDERYLSQAERQASELIECRLRDDTGCWWLNTGQERSGLGLGASGVSLFLLYLSLATGNPRYADVGREALRRVLVNGRPTIDGGLTWPLFKGDRTVMPSWKFGSAGVGIALLRYRAAFGDHSYDSFLHEIDVDTDRKYSIFVGQHLGLSGWGEFYLDWQRYGPPGDHLDDRIRRVAAGVLAFALERSSGLAFPGETRTRVSCDFATGSAGVAHFLHRVASGQGAAFMLDELLTREADRAATPEQVPTPTCL